MSDKDVQDSYERSTKTMSGENITISVKIKDTNDPNDHHDLHDTIKVDYDAMGNPISMEEVHKLQREHIKNKDDQGKDGYPLNVIIDPAMRDMYKVVHKVGMTYMHHSIYLQKL